MFTRTRNLIFVLLVVVLVATACSGRTAERAVQEGPAVFVAALTSEPSNLNPIFLDINAGNWKIFNGIVKMDEHLNIVPDLASEMPSVSEDGKTVTVTLRDDVRFHDGERLTAEDVVFTWQSLLDPEVATPARDSLALHDLVEEVQAIDEQTVRFSLLRPDPAFVEKLYVGIVPQHLLEGENLNETPWNRQPVGTGPYKFTEWLPGDRLVLDANPDYFDGPVEIQRLVFTFVGDDNARAAMLRNGEIDFARLSPQLAATFADDPKFQVIIPASASISQISLPNDNPVLRDARVRRALSLAIDRKALVESIWNGLTQPAYGPILPGHWAYDEESAGEYDPDAAIALLQEAGWERADDGFMVKDGQRLEFTLMYLPNQAIDKQLALAVRSDLSRIGVDVEVEGVASPGYEDRLDRDAWLHGIGLPYDPDYVYWSQFHSSFADDDDPSTNRAKMRNVDIDRALEDGRASADKAARRDAYIRLQRALREDGSYLYLTQRAVPVVVSSRFTGIVPQMMGSPHAFIRGVTWNIEKWAVQR